MANYTIQQRPEILIMGIACRTSNAPGVGEKEIPQLWQRFYQEEIMEQVPNRTSDEVIALYCEYEGDHTAPYTLVIGCPVSAVDALPEGLVAKSIPKGAYAEYQAVGEHPAALVKTWGEVWATDLPRTYGGDYEVYAETFASDSPQKVGVYIGLEA